jgi:hypothetical protein
MLLMIFKSSPCTDRNAMHRIVGDAYGNVRHGAKMYVQIF